MPSPGSEGTRICGTTPNQSPGTCSIPKEIALFARSSQSPCRDSAGKGQIKEPPGSLFRIYYFEPPAFGNRTTVRGLSFHARSSVDTATASGNPSDADFDKTRPDW